jgi:DNA-binding MarR family transcriptional regulator
MRLVADREREGLSAAGFSVLVVLVAAGGKLRSRPLRRRLGASRARAAEQVAALERRGLVTRRRRAVSITPLGAELVDRLFPEHAGGAARAFPGRAEDRRAA